MSALKYCEIRNKGYGQKWQNFRLYYMGPRPKLLREDGAFSSGKSLLEALAAKFRNFELILTPEESRLQSEASAQQVYLAVPELRKMNELLFAQKKTVTQQAVSQLLAELFPKHFTAGERLLSPPKRARSRKSKPRLSLKMLRRLAKDLKERLQTSKSESAWRDFLKQNILFLQRGYIEFIPKAKVGVRGVAYPEFCLITHDGYVDILEIKTPSTPLLADENSPEGYGWSRQIAETIGRAETHLQAVSEFGDKLRQQVKEGYGIQLPVIKPRAIIFAGNSEQLRGKKAMQEAFGRLNQALNQVSVVTYDELLTRLRNQITALRGVKRREKPRSTGGLGARSPIPRASES